MSYLDIQITYYFIFYNMNSNSLNYKQNFDISCTLLSKYIDIKMKRQKDKHDVNLAKSSKISLIKEKCYNDFCNICFNNFKSPILLICLHKFCCKCINEWFKHSSKCPICKSDIVRKV